MVTSALISNLRREYGDNPKTTKVSKTGDGATKLFNLGQYPVVESSYGISKGTSGQTETTHFTIDLDNGDLTFVSAPAASYESTAEFKYAHWRDKNWLEAINSAIESLNARGFFRQVVRNKTIMALSANVREYNGPSACIDLYEVLESSNNTTSGTPTKLGVNWSYQQDANKLILGSNPSVKNVLWISYLRNLQASSATSSTLDVLNDWIELIKKKAGANFYKSLAGKIAKQGSATIDEGHFSFTNLRTMATDLESEFNLEALRKKPTRPAKDIGYHIAGSGPA